MSERNRSHEPPRSDAPVRRCLRLLEALLSLVVVLIVLWRTLCGPVP